MLHFNETLPLSLYLHLPWCVKKCPYCDFNSHAAEQIPAGNYVAALIRDLETELPRIWGRRIGSIFIGGGTPSLFPGAAIEELLCALHARLNFNPAIEITLEANPGTVDGEHFRAYRKAGVNRLSIGVQSFNDAQLTALGRVHDAAQARRAIETARAAGFDNLNLDLMMGLPGQDVAAALDDLQTAIDIRPEHISWYQLTLEPNTVFYSKPPELPDDGVIWDMQLAGQERLQAHGYRQYEVSAWARDGHRCSHNLNYWQFGDYLGIGAGAHGKLTDIARQRVCRSVRHRLPDKYMQLAGQEGAIVSQTDIGMQDLPLEFMLNALRLTDGFASRLFLERCGMPLSHIDAALESAQSRGLINRDHETIRPTSRGLRYLNDLLLLFMPEPGVARGPYG